MSKINTAVKDGGDTMEKFAEVSGMSGQEFSTLWENDPYKAIMKFEGGVKQAVDQGQNHKTLLKELGITELRETDTVLRLANGNKQLADAREHANKGWKEGTALSDEAEKKYQSLGNQMKLFMNHVRALGIEIGAALTPILKIMMKALIPVIDALASAPAPIKLLVVALGLIPVIAVPVLASLAAITGAMGLMGQAMNTGAMAATRNGRALRIYAGTVGLLTSPIATSRKALGLFSGSLANVGTKSGKTSKALSGMPGVFRSTGKSTKGTTTIFQRLGKVMGALLIPFKLLLSPLKLLRGLMPLLGAGVRTLGLAFRILTGPIGIAVTILITLYKTIKYAYNNVEWFRKGVDGLIYTFKVFGGGIVGTVIDNLKKLGNWFSKTGESIKSKFTKNVQDSYKALDDDDLLKQGVEGFKSVMKTMGTATDKASDSVKVLGKGVSKETKGALGNYVKYSNSSNKILEQVKLNHGDISKKKATELLSIEEKLTNDIIEKLEKRKQDELKNAQEVFENSKALSQKEQDAIIAGIEDRNNKAINKEKELSAEIKRVKEEAMADGNISDKEMAQIEKLENQRRKLTVKNLTKTQKEQDKILSRMKNNREALSISEASSAIKSAEKARKARIKEIKSEYDDKVYAIDQMVGLSKEQKEKLLDEAEDEKNKQIDKANDKKEGVVKSVKDQNKNVESEMDTSNGKVYSNAEKWWKKTKAFFADDSLSQGFKKGMEGIGEWFSGQGAEFSKNFKEGWKTATQAGGDLWSWVKQTGSGLGAWFSKKGSDFSSAFKNGWATASQTGGDLWSWIKQTGAGIGGWFAQQGREFWGALKNGWSNAIAISGDIWSSIKQTGANIGAWFSQKGSQLWGSMKSGWNNAITTTGDLWNSLTTWLGSKWGLTKQWFITKGSNMWSSIKQGWNNLINTDPGALWRTLTTALGTAWEATKQWFITKGKQMGSAISTGWSAMKGFVVNTFSAIWTSVKVIWKGIWSTISYWAGAIWNRVKSVWSWIKTNTVGAFTFVWSTVKRIWTGIKNTIVYWTQAIWNRIKSVWSWIKSNTLGAFNYVWSTIKRIWKGIKDTIVYWTTAIWNRVKSVWNWIKSNTASAFTWAWNKIKSIWKGIKDTITYWTSAIWNRVKSVWNWIKSNTASVFTWVWNKLKSIWSGIKGTITYWTGVIWNRIKSIWTTIKNFTSDIFNSVWGTVKRIWTNIKNAVIDRATAMWNRVRGIWNSLKSGTTDIFNKAKNTVKSAFEFMKKHSVDLATGMWDKVSGIFNNMKDGTKSFASKVTGHINDMVGGIKGGLNKLIEGVNWVGGKLGIDSKIPTLHTGTQSTHRQNFVSNGKIKKPTLATVNDRGSGNGKGRNGHQEVIQRADGSMYAPKGRDVTVPLGKGDIVHNGRSVQEAQQTGTLPQFSRGTNNKKKYDLLKDAKKNKHKHGGMDAIGTGLAKNGAWGVSGGGVLDDLKRVTGAGAKVGAKKVTKKAADTTKKGKETYDTGKKVVEAGAKSVGKIKDDLLEYVGNPGKLVDLMLKKFGVDFGAVKGQIPKDMMWDPMWKGLKTGVKSLFDGWLTEADGAGDGGYIDLSKGINFGFARTAAEAAAQGYPFPRPHHGLDINYPYGSKLYSTLSGTAVGTNGYNGGFGNNMTITSGSMKAIYGHMSKLAWTGSKKVKPGDYIGKSGGDPSKQGRNAGDSTGAHLHYEMQRNGQPFDPTKWLKTNNGGGSKNKKASAWKDDIKRAAKRMKVSLKGNDLNNIVSLINAESTGNAGAVQSGVNDINSRSGNPAQGLLQYIPQTFRAYAMKGHKNIKSGYDQLLAFFNNKNWRSQFNPNGGWSPSGPRRFAHGGMIKKHGLYEAGEGNREEMILPLTNKVRAMQLIDQAKSFMGVNDEGSISTVDNNSSDDIVTQLLQQNNRLLEALINTVENKDLVVDKNSIVETANNGLGRMHRNKKYTKGGY